jgi:DNA-binding LacI/PurR family transcriptional regulator
MVADALLAAGHQKLAYISGEGRSSTNRDREHGFTERLEEQGHALYRRESAGAYTYEAGYQAAGRLLTGDNTPDAIFCASDLIAMGVLDFARIELGIKVPQELSIVGFDDIPMAGWPNYALTTVKQPIERMVDTAIEVLMKAIEMPGNETVMKWIPGKMVERTTARISSVE